MKYLFVFCALLISQPAFAFTCIVTFVEKEGSPLSDKAKVLFEGDVSEGKMLARLKDGTIKLIERNGKKVDWSKTAATYTVDKKRDLMVIGASGTLVLAMAKQAVILVDNSEIPSAYAINCNELTANQKNKIHFCRSERLFCRS